MSEFNIKLCMENGERLARIETLLKEMHDKKPCSDCKNEERLSEGETNFARMKQNLRIINWIGTIAGGSVILKIVHIAFSHLQGTANPF
jgi:hypothetical protein